MRGFDSGNIPTIDTLDEDNDDIWEKDLSWNILIISIQLYLLFCDLVMVFICESMKLLLWLTLFFILWLNDVFFYNYSGLFSCFFIYAINFYIF